jgi:SAM-dependent methyltransferase
MNILFRKMRSALIRTRRLVVSQRFGFDPAKIYAKSFYEDGGFARTEHSARVISAWIQSKLEPKSVLDLGSGAGYYLREFAQFGVEALGLEASPAGVSSSGSNVLALSYDLRRPVHLSRRFDVVMCIEVAEHIPKRSSDVLVESICSNANRFVVFTAAPPGTPGADHINCQPDEFWFALFRAKGFVLRTDLTEDLRRTADQAVTAEWWKSWSWCFQRAEAFDIGMNPVSPADGLLT